jgi:hypothetical protein
LHLEQEDIPLSLRNATLEDMVQMFNRAVSGLSARSYQIDKCSAATVSSDGTIVVTLKVFVWPSSLDLPYTLTAAYGHVEEAQPLQMEREIDVAVEGSDSVTLPWLMENATAWWQIPCVNEFSDPVPAPNISFDGELIKLSSPCYGVLRVRGLALGYEHTVILGISKTGNVIKTEQISSLQIASGYNGGTAPPPQKDPTGKLDPLGYTITNVNIAVTAAYQGDEQNQQAEILTLKFPACVLDLLEYCPEGTLAAQDKLPSGSFGEGPTPVVYYDTCTGRELGVHFVHDK